MAIQDEKTAEGALARDAEKGRFSDGETVTPCQLTLPLRMAVFKPGRFEDYAHTRFTSSVWLFLTTCVYFIANPFIIPFIKGSTVNISAYVLPFFYVALLCFTGMASSDELWGNPGAAKEIVNRRACFNIYTSSICIPASLFFGVGIFGISDWCMLVVRAVLFAYAVMVAYHAYRLFPWFDEKKEFRTLCKAVVVMVFVCFPVLWKMMRG